MRAIQASCRRRCSGAQPGRSGKAGRRWTPDGGEHPQGCGSGHSAEYCAYLGTEMLAEDAFGWFEEHGGLTHHANDNRFRQMALSRGNTKESAKMYAA